MTGRCGRGLVATKLKAASSQSHDHQSQRETLSSQLTTNTKGYIVSNHHLDFKPSNIMINKYSFDVIKAGDDEYFNNIENDPRLVEISQKIQNNESKIQNMMNNTNNSNNSNDNKNNVDSNTDVNNNDEKKKEKLEKSGKISSLSGDDDIHIDVNSNSNNNNNKANNTKNKPGIGNRLTESLSMFTNDELLRGDSTYYCERSKREAIRREQLATYAYAAICTQFRFRIPDEKDAINAKFWDIIASYTRGQAIKRDKYFARNIFQEITMKVCNVEREVTIGLISGVSVFGLFFAVSFSHFLYVVWGRRIAWIIIGTPFYAIAFFVILSQCTFLLVVAPRLMIIDDRNGADVFIYENIEISDSDIFTFCFQLLMILFLLFFLYKVFSFFFSLLIDDMLLNGCLLLMLGYFC